MSWGRIMENYEKILSIYKSWPKMLKEGYKKGLELSLKGLINRERFKSIVICGMGGSGIVGDFTSMLFEDKVSIRVLKDEYFPKNLSNSLVISISYSGETYETLSCTMKAKELGTKIYAITNPKSTLAKIVGLNNVVPVVENVLPRTALADMLGIALGLLGGKEYESEINKAVKILSEENLEEKAESIANKLLNKLPVISSCGRPSVVSLRWAQELAENAKTPSIIERYPESAHNSIVGWEKPPTISYSFLLIKFGSGSICEALESFLPKLYEKYGDVTIVDLTNEYRISLLGSILKSSLLAGLVSIKLAKLKNVDPMRTENIELYKSQVIYKLKNELLRRLEVGDITS
jgi:glucose/mannose-6-phosphate isomerase